MQQYGLTANGIQKRIEERWPVVEDTPSLRRVV
jgi:hypothetical protein